jgi:hypothetical protein
MKQERKCVIISFYNDSDGEYLDILNSKICAPALETLARMSCSIERSEKTAIVLQNPLPISIIFRTDNMNSASFQAMW